MKIIQFGLCFSPNLGDGVISDCIAHGIQTRRPDAQVAHIDLSARQGFGEVVIQNREAIIAVIDHLPLFLRQRLALWKLNRVVDGVAHQWRDAAKADLAIIGGGQIFADANLNFPIKIGRAIDIIAEQGTPCAVYGVGVSKNWTPRGKALFHKLRKADVRMIGVRDAGSQAAWSAQMPYGPPPTLTLDPGLLAASHYGPADNPIGVGLCITDFTLLAHHASGTVAGSASSAVDFYATIAREAVVRGNTVKLFSNGAAEDTALLQKVSAALAAEKAAGQVQVPPIPKTPAELVKIIANCSAVIAHRLHACIVAYSYSRPVVGLGWDAKLESFFATAGIPNAFSSDPTLSATDVLTMLDAARHVGIDPDHHARMMDEAWDGIDRLLGCATPATAAK